MANRFANVRSQWSGAVVQDKKLSSNARLLAVLLASEFADRDSGTAYPGQVELAKRIGVSDRTIRTLVKELETRRWLTTRSRRGRSGSTHYTLSIGKVGIRDDQVDRETENQAPEDWKPASGHGGLDRKPSSGPNDLDRKPASKNTGSQFPPNLEYELKKNARAREADSFGRHGKVFVTIDDPLWRHLKEAYKQKTGRPHNVTYWKQGVGDGWDFDQTLVDQVKRALSSKTEGAAA